jgi:hypothetical protein
MKGSKKGLSELITVVLLVGIGITAAGTAWHFGSDILSKQQTHQDIEEFEKMLNFIANTVEELSTQKGYDSKSIDLSLKGTFFIDIETNSITYTVRTEASSYGTSEVLLNDWLPGDSAGVVNINKYGVLSVKSLTNTPGEQTLLYTLQFRTLEEPTLRQQRTIELETPLQKTRTTGKYTLTVERGEEQRSRDPTTRKEIIVIPMRLLLS